MTAVYRWSAPDRLDLQATVKPGRPLPRFELFLASYFQGFPVTMAYVKQPDQAGAPASLRTVLASAGTWQMFARDDVAREMAVDGRWKQPPHPVVWNTPASLAGPLAVRRDLKSGLAVLLMAPAADCSAVSMPYGEEGHRSVYLSLFGRDLAAEQPATAHARLVVSRGISDQQAIKTYKTYEKER